MVNLLINGQPCQAKEGETVLEAARRAGIHIPALCYHEGVEPWGGCRVCMVEITHKNWGGWKGLVTACLYPVEEGLEVATDNEAVHEVRRVVLDLLLARCPEAEAIRKLAAEYGVTETTYRKNPIRNDCILCTLCVRTCAAKGPHAISTGERGASKRISIPFKKPPPDCIGCLACARNCPTSCIKYEETDGAVKIWGRTFEMAKCTTCGTPVMTRAQAEFEMKKTGLAEELFLECPECKKQKVVDRIGATFTP
jgi:NADH dehydrogenase/NADH:ubiquinone oxidoreductase subunit G